ncbi:hypothetical protein YC2023_081828 [Brassica napus]
MALNDLRRHRPFFIVRVTYITISPKGYKKASFPSLKTIHHHISKIFNLFFISRIPISKNLSLNWMMLIDC